MAAHIRIEQNKKSGIRFRLPLFLALSGASLNAVQPDKLPLAG
jgi:hypothetical protein